MNGALKHRRANSMYIFCFFQNDKDIRWAEGFMLVYDITNEESVNQMEHIKKKIESIRSSRSFCMVVVGNKTDLEHCREVRREKAEHIASRLSAAYHVDCSACGPAIQVRNAFDELCRQVALMRQQSAQKRERRRSSLSQVGRGLKMLVQTGKSKSHGPASSGSENGTTSPVGAVRQSSSSGNKKGSKFGASSSYTSLVSAPILNGLPEENPFFPSVETDDVIRRSHKRQNSETRDDFGKRASAHNINKTMYGAMVS